MSISKDKRRVTQNKDQEEIRQKKGHRGSIFGAMLISPIKPNIYEWKIKMVTIKINKLTETIFIGISFAPVDSNQYFHVYHGSCSYGSNGYGKYNGKWSQCEGKFLSDDSIIMNLDFGKRTLRFYRLRNEDRKLLNELI